MALKVQEVYLTVKSLVQVNRKLNFQLVRKSVTELMDVFKVVVCLEAQGRFQVCVQWKGDFIFFEDLVKN